VWPLEVLKNQIQASTPIGSRGVNATLRDRVQYLMSRHGGIVGLYRGIIPGTYRSMLSNGCSMVVMLYAQKKLTQFGLRN